MANNKNGLASLLGIDENNKNENNSNLEVTSNNKGGLADLLDKGANDIKSNYDKKFANIENQVVSADEAMQMVTDKKNDEAELEARISAPYQYVDKTKYNTNDKFGDMARADAYQSKKEKEADAEAKMFRESLASDLEIQLTQGEPRTNDKGRKIARTYQEFLDNSKGLTSFKNGYVVPNTSDKEYEGYMKSYDLYTANNQAFGAGFVNNISPIKPETVENAIDTAELLNPKEVVAGEVSGEITKQLASYLVAGGLMGAASGTALGGKIASGATSTLGSFGASQAGQLAIDVVAQAPFEVYEFASNEESLAEDAKIWLKRRSFDAMFNLGFGVVGESMKAFKGKKTSTSNIDDAIKVAHEDFTKLDLDINKATAEDIIDSVKNKSEQVTQPDVNTVKNLEAIDSVDVVVDGLSQAQKSDVDMLLKEQNFYKNSENIQRSIGNSTNEVTNITQEQIFNNKKIADDIVSGNVKVDTFKDVKLASEATGVTVDDIYANISRNNVERSTKELNRMYDSVSKHNKNIIDSASTNINFAKELEKNPLQYKSITNAQAKANAQNMIDGLNFKDATDVFYKSIQDGSMNPESVVMSRLLYNKGYDIADELRKQADIISDAAKKKEVIDLAAQYEQASWDISKSVQSELTKAGQFIQAANIMRDTRDPLMITEGILKELEAINEQGIKKYGSKGWDRLITKANKTGGVINTTIAAAIDSNVDAVSKKLQKQVLNEIDKAGAVTLTSKELDMIATINKNITDEQLEKVMTSVYKSVAERMPLTTVEKLTNWRKFAMLANPKTHARNFTGNLVLGGSETLSRRLSGLIQDGLTKVNVLDANKTTASGLGFTPKNIKDEVASYVSANEKQIIKEMGSTRYREVSMKNALNEYQKLSNIESLDKLMKFNYNALEAGDTVFGLPAYKDSLARQMKARGITTISDVTDDMFSYALEQAKIATYKQDNLLADALSKVSQVPYVGQVLDVVAPFRRTPANVLNTAIDYSPVGFVKSGADAAKNGFTGQTVDKLSRALLGTGYMALGSYLYDSGVLRLGYTGDRKVEEMYRQLGYAPNSIIVGDMSIDISQLQPISTGIIIGGAYAEAKQNALDEAGLDGNDYNRLAVAINGATSGAAASLDAILEQSFLQGLADLFDKSYGQTTGQNLLELPQDWVNQSVPTLVGQLVRTFERDKKQSDYSTYMSSLQSQLSLKTGIGKGSMPNKYDIFGNQIQYSDSKSNIRNAVSQLLNPITITTRPEQDTKAREATDMIYELYNKVGVEVIPSFTTYSFTNNGKKYELTPDQISTFQQTMGEKYEELLFNYMDTAAYKNGTDTQQAAALKKISSTAKSYAKNMMLKEIYDSEKQKVIDRKKNGKQ